MPLETHLTIGQSAEELGVPRWKIRRVVDSLDAEIPRVGAYRMVPRELLKEVAAALREQGWLPAKEASHAE